MLYHEVVLINIYININIFFFPYDARSESARMPFLCHITAI